MNKAEFGQLIKSKYPEYQNMDDEQLANEIIAKYPVYQNSVQGTVYDKDQPGSPVMKGLAKIQEYLGTSNALPIAYGTVGAIAGGGNPTATGVGAGLGEGMKRYVGKSLNPETTISGVGGISGVTPMTGEDVGGIVKTGGTAAATQLVFNGIMKALGAVLRPGATRANILGDKTVPTENIKEGVAEKLYGSDYYKLSPGSTQKIARTQLSNIMDNIAPLKTTGEGASMTIEPPANVPLNDIYKKLSIFEKTNKAYQSTAENGAASKLVSSAFRGQLNQEIPQTAKMLNKYMSVIQSPNVRKLLGIGGGTGLGYVVLSSLINKLKGK